MHLSPPSYLWLKPSGLDRSWWVTGFAYLLKSAHLHTSSTYLGRSQGL